MKYSLLTCLALVWLATAQAGNPKPIAATVGKEFNITLRCNPTTGYQWALARPPDEKLVKLLGSEYKRLDSNLLGAGGNMVWTFQALAKGKTRIGLDYMRSWEKGQKPVQTTNFTVVIKAPKAPAKEKTSAPAS